MDESSSGFDYNKSEIAIASKMAKIQSFPVIDIQQDFSWPNHSMVMKHDDPIDQACELFNRAGAAQHVAMEAQKKLKRHLIEYGLSRKKVREVIEDRNKKFQKISDQILKKEFDSDFISPIFGKHFRMDSTIGGSTV